MRCTRRAECAFRNLQRPQKARGSSPFPQKFGTYQFPVIDLTHSQKIRSCPEMVLGCQKREGLPFLDRRPLREI